MQVLFNMISLLLNDNNSFFLNQYLYSFKPGPKNWQILNRTFTKNTHLACIQIKAQNKNFKQKFFLVFQRFKELEIFFLIQKKKSQIGLTSEAQFNSKKKRPFPLDEGLSYERKK